MVFSIALGIATIILPLVALEAGYSNAMIGALTAVSAAAQMGIRPLLPWVMRRFPDRGLVQSAGVLMFASSLLLAASTALAPFLIVQVLQGCSRALFWTGSQTHAVREARVSTGTLAVILVAGGIGATIGPLIGGVVGAGSLWLAVLVTAGVALVSIVPTLALDRHPPFARGAAGSRRRIWRREGVDLGGWASLGSGIWRGLVSSYVPVVLATAGQSSVRVGLLLSAANVAALIGTATVARLDGRGLRIASFAAMPATCVGLVVCALVPGAIWLAAIGLVLAGIGAGVLQSAAPSLAARAVSTEERGDAIAAIGTARALAMVASPLCVGGLLTILPLGVAMAIVSGLVVAPLGLARLPRARG